jgi:phosphate regulon transcriptional regulator PhoB
MDTRVSASSKKILIIDDEIDLIELVEYNLKKEGFNVLSAQNGVEALKFIQKEIPSLIILDLMLPGIQGFEICKRLKNNPATSKTPIIMLTARAEEVDKVLGLELGADDYITKPFSPRELLARVKAVLRRMESAASDVAVIQVGDLQIDVEKYQAFLKGEPLNLSATDFKLLKFLATNRGRVYTRDQLLQAVWGDEVFVEPRTVDVHITRLRSQVEENPATPRYIKTVRGIGYKFTEQI